MKKLGFICLLVGIVISCDKKDGMDIKQVRYGTSFGECIRYCKNDILLSIGTIIYSSSGWTDTIELISCTDTLTNETWNSYKNGINPTEFFKLPETIGCPDCADGGAEWVEIEIISGTKHKVTFEYMKEPEELKNYVAKLREQKEQFVLCEN